MQPASAQSVSTHLRYSADLFSGPGYDYPRVEYIQAGRPIRLYGCLSDYAWCDISAGYARGWVEADNLAVYRGGQYYGLYESRGWYSYPITTFVFASYWNNYYRNRPWYHDRGRYEHWDWRRHSHRWNDRPRGRPDWHDRDNRPDWRDDRRGDWRDRDDDRGRPDWREDRRPDLRGRDQDNRPDWRGRDNDRDVRLQGRDRDGQSNWQRGEIRTAPVRPIGGMVETPRPQGRSGFEQRNLPQLQERQRIEPQRQIQTAPRPEVRQARPQWEQRAQPQQPVSRPSPAQDRPRGRIERGEGQGRPERMGRQREE